MFWLYLILLAIISFIPSTIQQGFYNFSVIQTQEFAILLIGFFILLVFLLREKITRRKLGEKQSIQKKMNIVTKDLTQSYSYIGEVNRKLDILEHIVQEYPESINLTAKKQKTMYDLIMESIKLLGKSDEFSLRFIRTSDLDVLKEIKSFYELNLNFSCKNLLIDNQSFESDEFFMITSPKAMDDVITCILIKKKNPNHKIEDLEIFKAIASQALFFFMFLQKNKKNDHQVDSF